MSKRLPVALRTRWPPTEVPVVPSLWMVYVLVPPLPYKVRKRICSRTHCHFPLPPIYRWKRCPSCRERSRDYQRRRLLDPGSKRAPPKHKVLTTENGLGSGGPLIMGEEKDLASGVAPDPIPSGLRHTAAPLTTPQASLAPVPADTIMGHPTQNFAWANQLFEFAHQLKTTSLCHPYQCHKDLLDDFSARLHYFIDTQVYRSHMGFPALQVMFDFSGEYSIVAADYDVAGRKVAVDVRVNGIEDSVASVTGLAFGPRSFYVRPYGVITRLCCFKMLHPLPATYAPALAPQNMLGELEIFVLPNVSHRYFPGEKTIVRFRLFG
ncbi:hypothetical protein B0H13DRAFT_1963522 [Mycena leptocephala]|nr:hypothetical protein B0H13DRAFT_1963522 [Mycena leptocephala]